MTGAVPGAISAAIAAEISAFPAAQIRQAAQRLSEAYRGRSNIRAALSPIDRAAYLAVRFPSTFAAATLVWREFRQAISARAVRSLLDAGAGPGTASLACLAVLDTPSITHLERDAGWRDLSQRLATAGGASAKFLQGNLARGTILDTHDVVIVSYALGELTAAERADAIAALWRSASMALIVIEPGTPSGFDVVRRVRAHALADGGHAAAPCTHDDRCPMSVADWCHRPVRVQRTASHRNAKGASLGYEDEKFSFVIMTREEVTRQAAGRIVRKPIRNKGHVHLDLCADGAVQRKTVARSDADYRAARDASWGDRWPPYDD